MQIIYILISILTALISINAQALEGKGVTLLSEKIESSPGIEGKFFQTNEFIPFASANTSAHANPANGKINQNISITGSHYFSVANKTRENQYYSYIFELNTNDGRFFRKTNSIRVAPSGNAYDSASSFFTTLHNTPGKWNITAATLVSGESSNSSHDHATLTVTK